MAIRVKVIDRGRGNLVLRWTDPQSGKLRQKATGTRQRRTAEREAAKLEASLRAGGGVDPSRVTWQQFRQRYEGERYPALAKSTQNLCAAMFRRVESILNPERLAEITSARVSYFQAELRAGELQADGKRTKGLREASVSRHLSHLKAALRWAHSVNLLAVVPKFHKLPGYKPTQVMKGRPITAEEFERILAKVPKIVGDDVAASWCFLLNGLWWSGLRLGEALRLSWEGRGALSVDLEGRRPMIRIQAKYEKGRKDRLLPMAPEFADLLEEVSAEDREGLVFRPGGKSEGSTLPLQDWVGKLIVRMGKAAGVKVHEDLETARVKFASAHDLRRAFGARWSSRVMPPTLQALMRHDSIDTTLRYYVGQDAERMADEVHLGYSQHVKGRVGDLSGDTSANSTQSESVRVDATPSTQES